MIDELLQVNEVERAEPYVSDLFRRRFGADPPHFPKHFVGFYRPSRSGLFPVGYVHYTSFDDAWLCGGLVIDDRLYRQMPAAHRSVIREAGGIAEILFRVSLARLGDSAAIWGHVGDLRSERVVQRVGFRRTTDRYVMVRWNKDLTADEKAKRLWRVQAIGPF